MFSIHTYIIYNIIYSNQKKGILYFQTQDYESIHVGGWNCNSKCSKSIRLPRGTASGEPRRPLLSTWTPEFVQNSESLLINIWPTMPATKTTEL